MRRLLPLIALVGLALGALASCAQESNVIGLQRPVYTDAESVITLHFFAQQSEAERYYRALEAEEYFLFTTPHGDAEELFHEIDGAPVEDGGKSLTFAADGEDSAIDQVLEFIDENGLVTFRSVHR